jgi:hypothetical protein
MGMVMALRWNADRPAFEAANPQRRAVSREPPPVELMSPELRAQLALAAMAPELIAEQGRQAAIALGMAPAFGAQGMPPPQQRTMGHSHGQPPQPPQQSGPPAYGQPAYVPPSHAQQPPAHGQQPAVYGQPAYGQPPYDAQYSSPAWRRMIKCGRSRARAIWPRPRTLMPLPLLLRPSSTRALRVRHLRRPPLPPPSARPPLRRARAAALRLR